MEEETNEPGPSNVSKISTPEGENNENSSTYQQLLEKYSYQQKELEKYEEQATEYREKLIKTIRERDLNEELLKSIRDETKKETEELKKRIKDQDIQLKAVQDKATAKEAHYNVTMKDLSTKYNISVTQLTKKADLAEKEKNEAVIKYATREAEIMRIRAEIEKKNQELKEILASKKELEVCQTAENVDQLEKTVNSLRVELEKIKHEKFDIENRLKMSEKRTEASQTSINELKQQCEVLRKQLIQTKEEKSQLAEENKHLNQRNQLQESRLLQETDAISKNCNDMETRLKDTFTEVARLKEENRKLNEQVDSIGQENLELLTKLQDLEDKLQLEEEGHERARKEAHRLGDIESQVKKSYEAAEVAKSRQENAEKDRDTAEKEAEACRHQAERMLQITEQLTERNSQLAGEAEQIRDKNRRLEQELVEAQGALTRATCKLEDGEKEWKEMKTTEGEEMSRLKEELKTAIEKEREARERLSETKNDYAAYKKKQAASLKELKQELAQLRRQHPDSSHDSYLSAGPINGAPSTSSRSRTSSLTSLDRATSGSQEETASIKAPEEPMNPSIQQAMIDKIVLLQRKLARRTEKIEFLEEHVRQCLEELQKKTKIIQHYALREEASLLLPSDSSMEQVPVVKKGSSYALMGSMFTTGDKKALQLATEVNSRLQAVLEDTLMKNITLKNSIDTLSSDNSRLTRENRLLLLTQTKD